MKKEIPLYKQPDKSNLCGPTCVRMIMAALGHKVSLKKITSEIPMRESGTSLANLGSYFLSKGYKAQISCLDTKNFNYAVANKNSEEQVQQMEVCIEKNGKNHIIDDTMIFIKNGGKFSFKKTGIEKLKEYIRESMVICRIDAAVFYKERKAVREAWHVVIPIKITKNYITILDPSPKFGGIKKYPIDDFLIAFYSGKSYTLKVS
jgi:ABC-type bacteriocin/lantibiotic exporter with double-glycine peptidase domain